MMVQLKAPAGGALLFSTTDDADDTNVWRRKRDENHDAEILSVMIRLIRG
jgi:hypothetical protein